MADANQAVTEWDEQGKPLKPQAAGVTEWDEKGDPIAGTKQIPVRAPGEARQLSTEEVNRFQPPTPFEKEKTPRPEETGWWNRTKQYGADILGGARGLAESAAPGMRTIGDIAQGNWKDVPKDLLPGSDTFRGLKGAYESDIERRKEGRSKPYRLIAGAAQATGIADPTGMEESARHGDPTGVLVHTAAQATPLAVAEAARLPIVRRGAEAIGARLGERSLAKSTKEIKEAAPPGRHEINYDAQLERARPYLAEEQRTAPVKSVREAHEVANSAVKGIEDKIGGYIDQLPETARVSGQDILDRATAKLNDPNSPRTPAERAAGIRELEGFLTDEVPPTEEGGESTRAPKDLSVKETDRLRWRFNRDLDTEMGMTEADRADVRASNPKFAAKEAAAEAMRDAVYDHLEEAGVPGVRQIRGDEGAVIQMRDAFRRNITRAEKSNAPSAARRMGVWGPLGIGLVGEAMASRLGLPHGLFGTAGVGLGAAGAFEWYRNRMRPNPLMERGFGRLGRSELAPNFPEMPIQGELVQEPPAAAQVAPPIAREVQPAAPTYPALTEFAGREPGAPPPATGIEDVNAPDERTLALRRGARQPVRGLLPESAGVTPPPPERTPPAAVNPSATKLGKRGLTVAAPKTRPTKVTPEMQKNIGVKLRGEFPEGHYDFQDMQTGGTIALKKEGFTEQALKDKVTAHREAMKNTPAEGKSDVSKVKQGAAEARHSEEPAKPAKEEFSPEQLEDAELGIRQELEMRTAGDRPGRYFDQPEPGDVRTGDVKSKLGQWRGVTGIKGLEFTQGFTPTEVEIALRRKAGRVYDTLVRRAVRNPEELEQAGQFNPERGIEPEVMPEPTVGEWLGNQQGETPRLAEPRGIFQKIQLHKQNIENLEDRLKEETGEDAAQTRTELEEEKQMLEKAMKGVQTQESEGVLPGMGEHVRAQEEGAGRVRGEQMTQELGRPLGNIEAAAGEMERKSPLFRGTVASPQGELLGRKGLTERRGLEVSEPPTDLMSVLSKKLSEPNLTEFERNTLEQQWEDLTGRKWKPREVTR